MFQMESEKFDRVADRSITDDKALSYYHLNKQMLTLNNNNKLLLLLSVSICLFKKFIYFCLFKNITLLLLLLLITITIM